VRHPTHVPAGLLATAALALAPTAIARPALAASAPGAWQTFIRAGQFTGLLADDDAVWGTTAQAGLVRWDRATSQLQVIRREPGAIASNRLAALALDRSRRLWVATDGAGVSRRSADGRRWDLVNQLDGLPSDTVRVLEATGDTVWIGTAQGFALWNGQEISGALPDGITVSFDTTFSSLSVTGIVLRGDSLWIATRRGVGLARLSTLLADWRPVNTGLLSIDVESLASDGQDVFAQAAGEAHRWREELGRWEPEAGASVVHRLTDASGVVLAAGEAGAFRWFRTAVDSGWTALAGSPASAPGSGAEPEIALAPDGRAFSALGETLFEEPVVPGSWIAHPLPQGPPGNDLLQVALDGPRVYVTTFRDGVGRYDGSWKHWPPVPCAGAECDTTFIDPRFSLGLLADRGGRKWVGCWSRALDSFTDDGPTPAFTHHVIAVDLDSRRRTWVVAAAQDSTGGRWFGMDTELKGDVDPIGLELYDDTGAYVGNFNDANSQMSGNFVHGLAVSSNDRVWIGYDPGGLDYVIPPADSASFKHLQSTSGQSVRGVAVQGDDVWMLTHTELWRFGTSAAATSQPAQKIPVVGGQALLAVKPLATGPDGAAWAGTTAGLHLFRKTGARDSFTTANSPIPSDEVRAVAVDPVSGVVWMTTPAGLASFDPAYVAPAPPPRLALRARVYPNPAQLTGLGIQLRITGDAESYTGRIHDLSGRLVRRFHGTANGGLVWDGRDADGRFVPPGVYFVRAEAEGRAATARVVVLR
jgi:hypothetical protein